MDCLLHSVLLPFLYVMFNNNMMSLVKAYQIHRNGKKITFFVKPTDYVVHIVWEKTPAVQNC